MAAEAALADALSVERWAAVIGGSMGGMRALEWAVSRPERTGSLLVLAAPAAASAEQIAWGSVQIDAIRSDRGGAAATTTTPRPAPVRTGASA